MKKLTRQEEHLGQLFEEMEQQMAQEKERILEEERNKERKLREGLANELRRKESLASEMLQQYEQARTKLDDLEKIRMNTVQEKERLLHEKAELEQRLTETESALNDCKDYIEMLQKKAREDRRTRAKAAIELSENIALERENLVRQLDTLRLINQKLVDDREERRQRYLAYLRHQPQQESGVNSSEGGRQGMQIVEEPVDRSSSEMEFDGDPTGMQIDSVNSMPAWASIRVTAHNTASRAAEAARRGSILGAYFNAG
ncbi:unnamed protein product [Echinostoma caproni]|uniref:DUF4515 domain-containing protein n=1 Tax=Echinostoma caproni TaxID=27848 RepID=A0A183AJG5_9TREM|nr:unnamed protein product [Echinostoma caproni]